jgi:hypothetical protein
LRDDKNIVCPIVLQNASSVNINCKTIWRRMDGTSEKNRANHTDKQESAIDGPPDAIKCA